MEVAGLVVGTVALAGVVKDCIDFYSIIVSARSLERDAEMLDTKLEIEKMLFLQWADRVGLSRFDAYDSRLDDPVTHEAVTRVLRSVRALLNEGQALQGKYGLRPCALGDVAQTTSGDNKIGTSRMGRLLRDFDSKISKSKTFPFEKPPNGTGDNPFPTKNKVRWVVTDKDKFAGLIAELSYFNSRLEALVPEKPGLLVSMAEEDLSRVQNIPKLKLILEATAGHNRAVEDAARRVINQKRVLQRLWFRWIDDRRESVKGAHFKTLRWALDPPKGAIEWDDLPGWLQQGSGIYWLAGKPGSGKSTLMKYLLHNPLTKELLRMWAGDSEIFFADFFFYSLGKPEQKSQEGLLRSLLFQVLSTNCRLIEAILPNMWREALATENKPEYTLAIPSIAEMHSSIVTLCRNHFDDKKLFIMIDGLDEYNGRHTEAASFFQKLGQNSNVKLLIASRTEPAFVAAFAHHPKMNLHDLTKEDVANYISHTIASHPYMDTLEAINPGVSKEITDYIANKASGVFLWVVLACRSVLEGFDDFDTIEDLKARIDELPPELEDLFRHMLLVRVNGRHREQGVKLLRLVFDNQTKEGVDPVPTLGLALVEEQGLRADFRGQLASSMPHEQRRLRCEMLEGRLRSRCCGLLEVQRPYPGAVPGSRVIFMHRSVYEFLCVPGTWQWDFMRINDETFKSHAILCMIWTQLVLLQAEIERGCVENALAHGRYAELEGSPPTTSVSNFSRLQGALVLSKSDLTTYMAHLGDCRDYCKDLSLGLAFAVEMGMTGLVRFAFEERNLLRKYLVPAPDHYVLEECGIVRSQGRGQGTPLLGCGRLNRAHPRRNGLSHSHVTVLPELYHATFKPLLHTLRTTRVGVEAWRIDSSTVDMVRFLVDTGHGPNEIFYQPKDNRATTPWEQWLWHNGSGGANYSTCCAVAETTKMLIESGGELSSPGAFDYRRRVHGLADLRRRFRKDRGENPEDVASLDDLWTEALDSAKERLVAQHGLLAATTLETGMLLADAIYELDPIK